MIEDQVMLPETGGVSWSSCGEWAQFPHLASKWKGRGRLVPDPGWVSVTAEPAPENHHSPQGPVAHFCKEPKMLFVFAKLFSSSSASLHPVRRLQTTSQTSHWVPSTNAPRVFLFRPGDRLSISAPCQKMCFRNKKEESPSETFSRELRRNLERRSASSVV